MSAVKSTKLGIREDKATAIANSGHGANVNAVGFNILFIAMRNPKLALEILKLFSKASKIKEADPAAPEEDFALFAEEVREIFADDLKR